MEESANYTHLDVEEMYKTEMKFEQGGVSQKFINNDKRRKETLIPGKLFITENKFGEYLEWKPEEPRASPSPHDPPGSSTVWPMVHGMNGGIGFKAGNEETVEFLPDLRASEFRRPIKIELPEIRSFIVTPKSAQREIIFILSDGTTFNPFVFERGSPENLITALERSISIKRSKHNKSLYIVSPKKESGASRHQNIAELFPDQINQINHVWGFMKELKNDPYSTTCTALAKIADLTCNSVTIVNGEISGNLFNKPPIEFHNTRSDSESVLRNGRLEDSSLEAHGMDADYTTNEEGYEVIFKAEKLGIELGPRQKTYRGQPLSQEQWHNYMDNEGRLRNFHEIKRIVFQGGVDPLLRKHVWGFILGLYDSSSSYEERRHQFTEKTCSYNRIKMQWATITEDQEERFHAFRDFKSLVEKDVARTDRTLDFFQCDNNHWSEVLRNVLMTYIMYNFNLGYVQGMSDILSPILMEVQDEITAFWIFVKFMERINTNFEMSQEGMQRQLRDSYTLLQLVDPLFSAYLEACDASNMYFEFRWLLIWFKREFSTTDTFLLWEALWTELPGPNFQLFVGLAILVQHRSTIMENKFGLSEILRHVNDLSMRIDLEPTLTLAEGMYLQIMEVEDKLPNNIRVIMGLPEKDEPAPDTIEILNGGGDAASSNSRDSPNLTNGLNLRSTARRNSDEVALESQYEVGVSQFM